MSLFDRDTLREAFNESHKTFRRAFIACACITAVSAGWGMYISQIDLHERYNTEENITARMEKYPALTKVQARNELLDLATENEKQIERFALYNTFLMLMMTGAFYHLQQKTKPKLPPKDNNNTPQI